MIPPVKTEENISGPEEWIMVRHRERTRFFGGYKLPLDTFSEVWKIKRLKKQLSAKTKPRTFVF